MQKNQLKPARDKKKNIETGLLMGQNTNIFSQLSATFLQGKAATTLEEEQFLKNTQIVEYHDQNINRLISLLRKKAEVTKVKAALELAEEVGKMEAEQVEEFMPTFAQLFQEIVLNEPSKQIVEEFVAMASGLIVRHKKVAVREISTLYGPLLLTMRLGKLAGLLFTGSEAELQTKALVLLLKKEASKKFLVMTRIILESDTPEKVAQAHFQRNCHALMKTLKDFFRIYDKTEKAKQLEPDFTALVADIEQALHHRCIDEYFKIGGKAKGAILELQSALVAMAVQHPEWKIEWQHYAKTVSMNFLEKDPLVQQTLWRSCNRQLLESLLAFDRLQKDDKGEEAASILNNFLPKSEEKLIGALKVGGIAMYKELHSFCEIFPATTFTNETHKSLINKLTFQRKLLTAVLQEEDENEARIQCYYNLVCLLLPRVRALDLSTLEEKKAKEVKSLAGKFERQTLQNLQERFYTDPPASKNSFTYYIPPFFAKIANELKPAFEIKFHPELTFRLYEHVQSIQNEGFLDEIFSKCEGNIGLLLKYMEIFPARPIKLDMSEKNAEVEQAAKLFILANSPAHQQAWFREDWDIRKAILVYDTRISLRDLQRDQEQEEDILTFRPSARTASKLYDRPELDDIRFQYFLQVLHDSDDTHTLRYLIPLVNDVLLPRNPALINNLLGIYKERADKLQVGKWAIGKHEISLLRTVSFLTIELISKEKGTKHIQPELLTTFLENYCQFARLISNYKMNQEVDDLLKRLTNLLLFEELKPTIFHSCRKSVLSACQAVLKGGDSQQEKVRKNRLIRCVDLIAKLLWSCLSRTNSDGHVLLAKQLIANPNNWKNAMSRVQPWILLHTLLERLDNQMLSTFASLLINNLEENRHFIVLVLNADGLLSLQTNLEVRQLFVSLKKSLQKQVLQIDAEKQKITFRIIFQQLFTQGSIQLAEGVKNLISFILIENQDNPEALENIGEICVHYPFNEFVKEERSIFRSLIFIDIISVIPLRKVKDIQGIYILLLEKMEKEEGLKYFELLSIACVFWNKSVCLESALETFDAVLSKAIKSCNHHSTTVSPLTRNFSTYTLFTVINSIVSHTGRSILDQNEAFISSQFWRNIDQGTELHGLTQAARMRYATRSILTAKEETLQEMISRVPKVGLEEFLFYRELLAQIEDDNEEELPHHEHIITLFQEFAEFLLRSISHLSFAKKPEEEVILELIQCPFPALKKAAFLLLKAMYQLKVVSREPPKTFESLLKFEIKNESELTTALCSKISTYLYTWQALLLRREATEKVEGEEVAISLEDYIQSSGLSDMLIRNCFIILEDKLDFQRNESDFPLSSDELLRADYEMDLLEESGLEQKIFKMTVQTLFLYIVNFPIFLRNFMDQNKKYKNICDRLLRSIISDAIFKQEVAKIELHEQQWKAAGNFEIYVTPKNKEIYAEYTHDVIRIGLRLVMRGNYPLSPIDIQFGQGLKIDEGSRWGLMLQSQLHNRNNTIINGILLWKENIDKKLSGVEECAICFDIVNSSGQLPKKACKTCRKKFHGNCIMKWFAKSNKSECPLCKSQFL